MIMGQRGEVDALLVHSPDAEKKFMAEGAGSSSRLVMHNDFIIVGPTTDPAKVLAPKPVPRRSRKLLPARLYSSPETTTPAHTPRKLSSGKLPV